MPHLPFLRPHLRVAILRSRAMAAACFIIGLAYDRRQATRFHSLFSNTPPKTAAQFHKACSEARGSGVRT